MKQIYVLSILAMLLCVSIARGTLWHLDDGNSDLVVSDDTAHGVFGWSVENPSVVNGGGGNFWYREGSTGGESYLGTVGPTSGVQPSSNLVTLLYDLGNVDLQVDYQLQGEATGSMESRLFEAVTISNASLSAVEFHLFQDWSYSFVGSDSESMEILNGNQSLYQEGNYRGVSVYSPDPDHYIATAANLVVELADGNPTTFSDLSGPAGPGFVNSGFQWDFTLAVGETRTFNVEHHVFMIPEPSTWALMLTASLLFGIKPLRRKLRALASHE
ncbi:MAG: PEP-CTERM sorting domain-containing protein [Verrucomicrobia bacterium]|nr:PEP-CTERM sorting domain-containing protein [Verrucomicrobiota bacterium]